MRRSDSWPNSRPACGRNGLRGGPTSGTMPAAACWAFCSAPRRPRTSCFLSGPTPTTVSTSGSPKSRRTASAAPSLKPVRRERSRCWPRRPTARLPPPISMPAPPRTAGPKRPRRFSLSEPKEAVYRSAEGSVWSEIAEWRLACGNCTLVGPTCCCRTVEGAAGTVQRRRTRSSAASAPGIVAVSRPDAGTSTFSTCRQRPSTRAMRR